MWGELAREHFSLSEFSLPVTLRKLGRLTVAGLGSGECRVEERISSLGSFGTSGSMERVFIA